MLIFVCDRVGNFMDGDIAGYKHFLLFPVIDPIKDIYHRQSLLQFVNTFNLDKPKIF